MRRTMPSAPGAVETWMRSSGWWKSWTTAVRSSVRPSSGTRDRFERVGAGHGQRGRDERRERGHAIRRTKDTTELSGTPRRFADFYVARPGIETRRRPYRASASSAPRVVPDEAEEEMILPAPVDAEILAGVAFAA